MIGGDHDAVRHLDPIFKARAPERDLSNARPA
jgi:6-phosphogluconate dehydrogenase (decarboxylating)